MSFELQPGPRGSVHNQYGARDTDSGAGSFKADGPERIYEFILDETSVAGTFLPPVTVYEWERILSITAYIDEPYAGTGESVTLTIGGKDIALVEAELEGAQGSSFVPADASAIDTFTDPTGVSIGSAGTIDTYGKVRLQVKTQRVAGPTT